MEEPLILVAASGLAREAAEAVRAAGRYSVLGLLDDNPAMHGHSIGGRPVLGGVDDVGAYPHAQLVVCAGRGSSRAALVERLTGLGVTPDRFGTVIHPAVSVPESGRIGAGAILLAGCVLTADVEVGAHVVAMPHVTLTHDDRIADFVTLCAGVTLGGSVHVGSGAYLGMNSAVRENLEIGAGAVLGMGAVALRPIPAGQTWVGNPAAPIREKALSG